MSPVCQEKGRNLTAFEGLIFELREMAKEKELVLNITQDITGQPIKTEQVYVSNTNFNYFLKALANRIQ